MDWLCVVDRVEGEVLAVSSGAVGPEMGSRQIIRETDDRYASGV